MEKYPAIYIRVSTDAQMEGYSIGEQKEITSAYCTTKGLKNYKFFIDGGWSGSDIMRPEMQHLIQEIEKDEVSHVIIYKLDRLSRSQKDTMHLIEDVFIPHKISFVSITESLDTSTPTGMLMIGILAAFAQQERANIKLRTRMGMLARVKDGYWMGGGRVPFGYDYDSQQGILVPNKDSEKVKLIYQMYIDGMSPQKIANELGLKYDRLVVQILMRKINYGIIEYNGVEYDSRHAGIISKETYDKAMQCMERRKKTKTPTSAHLLTGLVYCGKCGAKMRYQKWGDQKNKLVCYSQYKDKKYLIKDENCNQDKVSAEEVENMVLNALFQLKEDKREIIGSKNDKVSIENVLKKEMDDLKRKTDKLYDLYSMSDDNDEILLNKITENKKRMRQIVEQIEKEETKKPLATMELKEKVDTLEGAWGYMTTGEQQKILRILIEKITITNDNIEVDTTF